jgi:hypothetical protein
MAVEIVGEVTRPLDTVIKQVLHKALDSRPDSFVVHVSQPHNELVVHIRSPVDRRLKFSPASELEIGRELYTTLTAIVDERLSSN